MAETIEGLYLRIGLKYDELNQDFVAVEETLSSNIARLNRQYRLIDLKAKIALTGVTDESKRLEIQARALTQQIELTRQKVKLYETAWLDAAKTNGTASTQAEKASVTLKQQQLYLARLSQSLQEVTARQKEMADATAAAQKQSQSPLGMYQSFKGDISGAIGQLTSAFSGLKEASSSADSAIMKSLEIIGSIPTVAGKVVAALASIPLVIKGVENSLMNLAEPAISSGDAIYAMSRGVQMSISDFAKFSTICKVTGIEVNEVTATIRRLQTQITKAGDGNTLTRMLEKYGVAVRDSNGELKDALKMSEALAEGLAKAQAAGKSREFISALGRGTSGDFITYLEDLAGNMELAGKIVKNGLANPALAHEVQGNINALNTQAAQLKDAYASAFMPITNQIVQNQRERLGELTKVFQKNADSIKQIGYALAEVTEKFEEFETAAAKAAIENTKRLISPDKSRYNPYALFDKYKDDKSIRDFDQHGNAIVSVTKLAKKELESYSAAEKQIISSSDRAWQAHVNKLSPAFEKLQKHLEEEAEAAAKAKEELKNTWQVPFTDEEWEESLKRIKKYAEELAHIQIDLEFGEDSYGKSLAELDLWNRQALEQAGEFIQERNQIEETAAAKLAQIERDKENRISEIRESANAKFRTDLENQLAAIEKQKKRWIHIGMEEAEAEILAQREKADAISKLNQSVAANLDSIWQSSLEKRLAAIEREKQAWIQKGVDEVKSTRWAEQAKADAQRAAASSIADNQGKLDEYDAYRKGGYTGLQNYKDDKEARDLFKQYLPDGTYSEKEFQKRMRKIQDELDKRRAIRNATPEELADFQRAQELAEKSRFPNLMTERDKLDVERLSLKDLLAEQERLRAKNENNYIEDANGNRTPLYEVLPDELLEKLKQRLEELDNAAENYQNQLEQPAENETPVAQPETDIAAPFEQLSPAIENVSSNFDNLAPTLENLGSNFDDLTPIIENVNSYFDDLSSQIAETTSAFGNLIERLNQLEIPQQSAPDNFQQQAVPTEITNNVTITEAHAWDYSHIQELAEKVAEVITPRILGAIGGDSNSY